MKLEISHGVGERELRVIYEELSRGSRAFQQVQVEFNHLDPRKAGKTENKLNTPSLVLCGFSTHTAEHGAHWNKGEKEVFEQRSIRPPRNEYISTRVHACYTYTHARWSVLCQVVEASQVCLAIASFPRRPQELPKLRFSARTCCLQSRPACDTDFSQIDCFRHSLAIQAGGRRRGRPS